MPATHLTASMRTIRAHLGHQVTVEVAHDVVKELALRIGTASATSEDERLAERLKKATGLSPADLARYAEDWGG